MKQIFYDNIVVGSGISALGIIHGLIKKKKRIVLIDPQIDLSELNNNNSNTIFCDEKLPLPYFNASKWRTLDHFKLMGQKIFGGHTNFWGGNSLRFTQESISDWPIKYKDLEKFYGISEKILNVKHYDDDISKYFNIKKKLRNNLQKNDLLSFKRNNQIIFGKSRISKKNNKNLEESNKILNVKDLFNDLIKSKKIKLIKGELYKFSKNKKGFRLFLKKSNKIICCKKLFITTGPINTKKLIKNSISTKKKYMKLKQAQGFLVPAFLYKNISIEKKNNSLSDFHVIIKNFFRNSLYMELKYCPELIEETFKRRHSFLYFFVPKFFFKKILIIWGFIPSQNSFDYKILNKRIIIKKNQLYKKKIITEELYKVFSLINKNFNFFILSFFLKFTQFGRGYHIGSNLPMTKNYSKDKYLKTNINGELNIKNYKNLFIVDSSILSTIPSCSLGLTLFANAFRISSNIKN